MSSGITAKETLEALKGFDKFENDDDKVYSDLLTGKPPEELINKEISVLLSQKSYTTVIIPHDPPDPDDPEGKKWFITENDPSSVACPEVTDGNEVQYLIGGFETFTKLKKAMEGANTETAPDGNDGSFVYMANWICDIDVRLDNKEKDKDRDDIQDEPGPNKNKNGYELESASSFKEDGTSPDNLSQSELAKIYEEKLEKTGTGVSELLEELAGKNVEIRALFTGSYNRGANSKARDFINGLKGRDSKTVIGKAYIDSKTKHGILGVHHQKILIAYNAASNDLVAFCGGIEFNSDRTSGSDDFGEPKGQPLHDVHCKIRGPAAYDILKTFIDRWEEQVCLDLYEMEMQEEHRDDVSFRYSQEFYQEYERLKNPRGRALLVSRSCNIHPDNRLRVQIVRTIGGVEHGYNEFYTRRSKGNFTYTPPLCPEGERSINALIMKSIQAAERFIYVEDQYLVSKPIAKALADRLADTKRPLEHVTFLIAGSEISDFGGVGGLQLRYEFLKILAPHSPERFRVYYLCNPREGEWRPDGVPDIEKAKSDDFYKGSYVHAKVWVFDDRFAIIGSSNCNERGMSHDSEIAAGIFDPSRNDRLHFTFAHRLRISLWARHLNMDNERGYAALADGAISAKYWDDPPEGVRVRVLRYLEKYQDKTLMDLIFHFLVDPVGR